MLITHNANPITSYDYDLFKMTGAHFHKVQEVWDGGFSTLHTDTYTIPIYPYCIYFTASLGVISNPIGALLGGMMVDAVGRRLLLQSIVLPNLVGWLVIAFSETYIFLCIGRFITGFTIGKI